MRVNFKVTASSTLFYITLVLAFSVLLVFFFIFKDLVNEGDQCKLAIFKQKQIITTQNMAIDELKEIIKTIVIVDGEWINPGTELTSEDNEVHYLHELVSNNPKLIFRYTKLSCDICVEKEVFQLKNLIEEIGADNVILIASFESKRDISRFKKANDIEFEIFSCEEDILGIEKSTSPYYLILNSNCQIEKLLLPQKQFPELTQTFYNSYKDMVGL